MSNQHSPFGGSAPLHANYESALKDSAFVRSLLDIADDCVALLSLDGRLEVVSPRGLDVLGIEDFGRFEGQQWLDFWNGPHLADAEAALNVARAGRVGKFQGYADTVMGATKFWDVRVSPIMGVDGTPRALAAISRDMTLLKDLEKQRDESLAEMRHRAKNALTIVQAIAQQTLKAGGSEMQEVSRVFLKRIHALARSYDALLLRDWAGASLRELLQGALEPFVDSQKSRIHLVGPDVELIASQAVVFSLAINELATNAGKYGAWSNEEGYIDLSWEIEALPRRLRLIWRETNGPAVTPPTHRGFGSTLIHRALPGELGGEATVDYRPEGVVCEIIARLPDQEHSL